MNFTRIAIATLCSGWFFLASCTTGAIVGTRIVAVVDARHASDGDTMHGLFSVVVSTSREGASFAVFDLEDVLERPEEYAPFLMSNPYGETEGRDSLYSYKVIEQSADSQIIEVVEAYRDGDNTIWSRYRATADGIEPISSRMMYFGYAFAALPYALGLAFLLYAAGRILAWRNRAIMPSQQNREFR